MKKKKSKLKRDIPEVKTDLEIQTESLLNAIEEQNVRNDEMYVRLAQAAESHQLTTDLEDNVVSQADSLARSVGNIQSSLAKVTVMTDEMRSRLHDVDRQQKRKILKNTVVSNTQIDYEEQLNEYFAKGNNIYKMILVLVVTSFVGTVVETIWCYLRHGYFESRAGLVYGPFNLVYGMGGLVLMVVLYRFRNHNSFLSFAGGMLVGSVTEYLCSYIQEKIFGSTSWDYSAMPFNINGRICLLYSVFWGILGIWWIKSIYPLIAKMLLKIPNWIGKQITIVLLVFLVIDAAISGTAVYRWSKREQGNVANNAIERIIDGRFNDNRMKKIYPNLVFSKAAATSSELQIEME